MTLRIGMIGPGGMGQAHIERIQSVIAGGRVVAVADLNAEGWYTTAVVPGMEV